MAHGKERHGQSPGRRKNVTLGRSLWSWEFSWRRWKEAHNLNLDIHQQGKRQSQRNRRYSLFPTYKTEGYAQQPTV